MKFIVLVLALIVALPAFAGVTKQPYNKFEINYSNTARVQIQFAARMNKDCNRLAAYAALHRVERIGIIAFEDFVVDMSVTTTEIGCPPNHPVKRVLVNTEWTSLNLSNGKASLLVPTGWTLNIKK